MNSMIENIMNGKYWEWLKKIFRKEETQPERIHIENLMQINKEEMEKALQTIYPECNRICRNIYQTFEEIKYIIEGLSRKDVSKIDPMFVNIAKEMKTNLTNRVSLVVSMPFKEDMKYFEMREFYERALKNLEGTTKISFDNRYLFTFFEEDMKELRRTVKVALNLCEELRTLLEEKRPIADGFEKLKCYIDGLNGILKEIEIKKQKKDNIEWKLKKINKEYNEIVINEKELERAEKIRLKKYELRCRISGSLIGLERALRKFEKVCMEKEEIKKAERYACSPVEEILKEGENYEELKSLLRKLLIEIQKDKIKLKNKEKMEGKCISIINGSLSPLISEYKNIEIEEKKLEKPVNEIERRIREKVALKNEIKKMMEEIEEANSQIKKAKLEVDVEKKKIEELFKELTKKRIEIYFS